MATADIRLSFGALLIGVLISVGYVPLFNVVLAPLVDDFYFTDIFFEISITSPLEPQMIQKFHLCLRL